MKTKPESYKWHGDGLAGYGNLNRVLSGMPSFRGPA